MKGKLRIDFYDNKKKYLLSKVLQPSEIIILISGGHGFKTLNKCEMIEVKQGPYSVNKDKMVFCLLTLHQADYSHQNKEYCYCA